MKKQSVERFFCRLGGTAFDPELPSSGMAPPEVLVTLPVFLFRELPE
jgi:hypothetical protein